MYNTERQDSTNVYHKALIEFCGYVEKYFPEVAEVTVESTPMITMFPQKMGNLKIEYLPRSEVKKEFKKKGLKYYCVITPMLLKSGEFIVNVIPFRIDYQKNLWTKFKNNEIGYVSDGGIKSRFKYDCHQENLTFLGSEGGFGRIE
ncbi:hypothetical protein [Algoriphagus yeomjeoni]|nr:hypothetical protein [Algoriphagus yeomjeoni]